jgi:hypothetical protein
MRSLAVLSAASLLLAGRGAAKDDAIKVESARFEVAQEEPLGGRLRLVGAGVYRWGWFVKVYAAAHYVEARADADPTADVPRRLELVYLVGVPARRQVEATEAVLSAAHRPDELAPLRARLDRVEAAFRDVRPGDRYAFTYVPGRGTEFSLNGEPLVTVPGAEVARICFGIWLGDHPVDAGLRRALLADRRAGGPGRSASARR